MMREFKLKTTIFSSSCYRIHEIKLHEYISCGKTHFLNSPNNLSYIVIFMFLKYEFSDKLFGNKLK